MNLPGTESGITLVVRRTIKAPREKVFRAWTEPEELKKWFGPEGMECTSAEMDLRVGGSYRISIQDDKGETHDVGGVYREIRPPERLTFTWKWENMPELAGVETLVTLEFAAKGNETELTLTHEHFPSEKARDEHTGGWSTTFDCLEKFLA
jgi:uncharacterized protein YndB with AHSA1/START domain